VTPYELALKEVGTVEWAEGSNPKVVAYYRDAGHSEVKDDAVAWCAAFVGAMLKRAGYPNTGSLAARSYLNWGEAVDPQKAQLGDICVFQRGGSTWQGHVGFFAGWDNGRMKILGGNQKDSVNVSLYGTAALLGVRRAKAVATAPSRPKATVPPKTPQSPSVPVPKAAMGIGAAVAALLLALTQAGHDLMAWIGGWFQ
jgi:uncharacterized protein (TIGR02594 family)